MKTVLSPANVAHAFANQTQPNARNSGSNFYFEDKIIYSYGRHFPIACHYNGIVLFTLNSYSNTTAKHISLVRSACSHKDIVLCLNPYSALHGNHSGNVKYWFDQIAAQLKKMATARKPQICLAEIERQKIQLDTYCKLFNITPDKQQSKMLTITNSEDYTKLVKAQQLAEKRAKQAEIKAGKLIAETLLNEWHEFKTDFQKTLTPIQRAAGNAYLTSISEDGNITRLRTNGIKVETSKGVEMPIEVAKRFYVFYTGIIAKGGCNGNGNCNYKMLDYDVKEATGKKLVVGCHSIPFSEIMHIANKLNW